MNAFCLSSSNIILDDHGAQLFSIYEQQSNSISISVTCQMEPNGFNITGILCLLFFFFFGKKLYGGFFILQITDLSDLDGIKISDKLHNLGSPGKTSSVRIGLKTCNRGRMLHSVNLTCNSIIVNQCQDERKMLNTGYFQSSAVLSS